MPIIIQGDIPKEAPIYPQVIILSMLAFPGWILCLSPFYWHFRQGNIAVASLILWIALYVMFMSINTLIWPRDNVENWWDGKGWCDINIRIQVGTSVGLPACIIMVLYKLVNVLDTRTMTVSSSRSSEIREKVWSIIWCWGYPILLIILYDIPQGYRYFIVGIRGCAIAFSYGWPGLVLSQMWGPITLFVATYYAGLLMYRLYRYRREFSHLLAAHNTTKSKFLRLFFISIIILCIFTPYAIWEFIKSVRTALEYPYDWTEAHSTRAIIAKVPVSGRVGVDGWIAVLTCYIIFLVFGLGAEANNQYKHMLIRIGLGSIFPGFLYENDRRSSPNDSFIQSFRSTLSSRTKSVFGGSKSDTTMTSTIGASTRNGSVMFTSFQNPYSAASVERPARVKSGFFRRMFSHKQDESISLALPVRSTDTNSVICGTQVPEAISFPSVTVNQTWTVESFKAAHPGEAHGTQNLGRIS